jgi:hypothetical protein
LEAGSVSPNRHSKNFRVFVVGKIDGGVSRLIQLPDGSGRIETWEAGKGWVTGGARAHEFFPPSCIPVSAKTAAQFRIPPSELATG